MNGRQLYDMLSEENAKVLRKWNADERRYEHTHPQAAWPFLERDWQRVFDNAARRLGERRVRKTYRND